MSLFFGVLVPVHGQAAEDLKLDKKNKIKAKDPSFDDLFSPEIATGNSKKFRPKKWLEVEVELEVEKMRKEPKDKFLDELKVNWYVVVKGVGEKGRKNYMIKKTVTYVNFPTDEAAFASVYLSPKTLQRITGKKGAGKRALEAIGGEIEYEGKMVGYFSYGKKAGWWRNERVKKNVEVTTKFPLLDKSQTPFAALWYDRYAEVKALEAK